VVPRSRSLNTSSRIERFTGTIGERSAVACVTGNRTTPQGEADAAAGVVGVSVGDDRLGVSAQLSFSRCLRRATRLSSLIHTDIVRIASSGVSARVRATGVRQERGLRVRVGVARIGGEARGALEGHLLELRAVDQLVEDAEPEPVGEGVSAAPSSSSLAAACVRRNRTISSAARGNDAPTAISLKPKRSSLRRARRKSQASTRHETAGNRVAVHHRHGRLRQREERQVTLAIQLVEFERDAVLAPRDREVRSHR